MPENSDKRDVCYYFKLLLYVAKEQDAKVTPAKYQKVFYLLLKELGIDLGLDYEPSFFGVHSWKLQSCVEKLVEKGLVREVEDEVVRDPISGLVIAIVRRYELNVDFKPSEKDKEVMEFFKKWVAKSRSEILKYVYEKYPEDNRYRYIRDKVLGKSLRVRDS
jgi:uncharacterized protein YwgA